ncbi:MAG: HlyD family efflux transporter periplasmic adaptor subunit, partial [Saprospiraceae bacterium]
MEEELRSEEVQEILGTPPSWMVRWGTVLVFAILALLAALGWWFRYPVSVTAPLTITTLQPPVPVFAPRAGYIGRLVVADGDSVSENAILAVMANQANLEDVVRLEEALRKIQNFDEEALASYKPDLALKLGELQSDYLAFVQSFQELSANKSSKFDRKARGRLNDQLEEIDKSIQALNRELTNAVLAKELAAKQFNLLQEAYSGKTNQEYDRLQQAKNDMVSKEKEVNRLTAAIADKRREKASVNLDKLELQQGSSAGSNSRSQTLMQSFNDLQESLEQWKQKNLLLAPASGTVTYYQSVFTERTPVQERDRVIAILPFQVGEMELAGHMRLPVAKSGKVQYGQRVLIKLTGFPAQEVGIVEGVVEAKALLAGDDEEYSVRIALPNGLKTSLDIPLPFRQEMPATGEIIIEDKSLLQRLLEKLWEVFGVY